MAQDKGKVYRVIEAFSFDHAGRPYSMRIGDLIDSSHPAFNPGRMSMLEEVSEVSGMPDYGDLSQRAVETTTAVPGTRRSTTRPRGE